MRKPDGQEEAEGDRGRQSRGRPQGSRGHPALCRLGGVGSGEHRPPGDTPLTTGPDPPAVAAPGLAPTDRKGRVLTAAKVPFQMRVDTLRKYSARTCGSRSQQVTFPQRAVLQFFTPHHGKGEGEGECGRLEEQPHVTATDVTATDVTAIESQPHVTAPRHSH